MMALRGARFQTPWLLGESACSNTPDLALSAYLFLHTLLYLTVGRPQLVLSLPSAYLLTLDVFHACIK